MASQPVKLPHVNNIPEAADVDGEFVIKLFYLCHLGAAGDASRVGSAATDNRGLTWRIGFQSQAIR
jgi:hypothetical protein